MRVRIVVVILAVMAVVVAVFVHSFPLVDVGFATKGYVRFHYADKSIDAQLSKEDLEEIKDMLVRRSFVDSPACGFSTDVSIRLTDGQRSIVFCPACDTCATLQIGDSNRYISVSEKQRDRLDRILAKYGVCFPCV